MSLGDGSEDGTPITADSTPEYDGLNFDNYWNCDDWEAYGNALLAAATTPDEKAAAQAKWKAAWDAQSIWAWPYTSCKYDSEFVTWVETNIDANAGNILTNVVQATNSASKVVKNVADTAASVTSPGVLLGIGALALILLLKR